MQGSQRDNHERSGAKSCDWQNTKGKDVARRTELGTAKRLGTDGPLHVNTLTSALIRNTMKLSVPQSGEGSCNAFNTQDHAAASIVGHTRDTFAE